MRTRKQVAIVEAGVRWAERDRRVRALLLKGSLARGDADERSDVDFVVVAQPGRLEELWAARHSIAEGLGGWLGGFDEVAWQAPHTFIGFCDGPVKVDFFFQEAEPAADPWLRDGFRALVDPDGLADRLRRALAAEPPPPDLSDFDVHAWDWLWAMHLKLRRPGHEWLVYVEQVKFVETMLLTAFNALAPEPWRGVLRVDERLPAAARCRTRQRASSPTRGSGAPPRRERSRGQLPRTTASTRRGTRHAAGRGGRSTGTWSAPARPRTLDGERYLTARCSFRLPAIAAGPGAALLLCAIGAARHLDPSRSSPCSDSVEGAVPIDFTAGGQVDSCSRQRPASETPASLQRLAR